MCSFYFYRDERAVQEVDKSVHIYETLDASLKCPRRYVSFIQTFSSICGKKTDRIFEQQQRIQVFLLPLSIRLECIKSLVY